MNVFDQHMPTKSNSRKTEDIKVTEQDLLETQRNNYRRRDSKKHQHIRFIPCFMAQRPRCSSLTHLMEDAATAEIKIAIVAVAPK
jgi:hypothetical protein